MQTLTFKILLGQARFCKQIGMNKAEIRNYLLGVLVGARFYFADKVTYRVASGKKLVI